MSLNLALSAAISGLQTSQKGLDVVSHNLANVNTEGYTRKTFVQESVVLTGEGSGVQTAGIQRTVDENLNEDLREELAKLAELNTLDDYYQRVQDFFGTPGNNTSISHRVNELSQQLETLALEPDRGTEQLQTINVATSVVEDLNDIGRGLQDLRQTADGAISTSIAQINEHLVNIDNLNEQITLALATSQDATNLQDKRDLELQGLQELIDVTTFNRDGGALVIYTKKGTTLLDTEPQTLSHTSLSSISPWETKAGSDIQAINVGSTDITSEIGEGTLKALIDMRDSILPNAQAQADELAAGLKSTLNLVHNRGTSHPTVANSYQGTRNFIPSTGTTVDTQSMTLTNGDTVFATFDTDGNQTAQTTLNTIMTSASFGTGAQASGGPWTIEEVRDSMQDWLRDTANGGPGLTTATVAFDSNNRMTINLNDNNASLAFRDQTSSTAGATRSDVTIGFDSNNDGTNDETVSGFSNFFGLNDLYENDRADWIWDSGVKAANYTPNINGVLQFYDTANPQNTGGTGGMGSVTIQSSWTLSDIANAVNNSTSLNGSVEAEVVPDGDGYRLRLKNVAGNTMTVTQQGGTTLTTELGLAKSNAGVANSIAVKQELVDDDSKISRGAMLYNSDSAEYFLSAGDNTVANEMAAVMQTTQSFSGAGGLSTGAQTLADYAALVVSRQSSLASNVEVNLDYQAQVANTLTLKTAEISAVNMDEELAQLLIYEQAYQAAARVISTAAEMLDVLNSIVD
ncbi:MAG: flagellar hook-associated protein FlgK [Rhodospirillaceae bacterium]